MANQADNSMVNPLDVAGQDSETKKGSQFLQEIVSTETSQTPENILDAAPEVDTSLLQNIQPQKSILLMVLKILFVVMAVFGVTSFVFFSSQLTNRFEFVASKLGIPNISKELASTNAEILNLQTDLNFYRHLQVKAYLDEFSFYGDAYTHNFDVANSQTTDSGDKQTAAEEMNTLRNNLREALTMAKDKYIVAFEAPLFSAENVTDAEISLQFKQKLTEKLNEQAREFVNNSEVSAQREYKNFTHTINLITNQALKNILIQTDFDQLTDQQLYSLVKNMNDLIVNDLSIIQEIKDQRIKWSDIINEIELRTIEVDRFHADDFYENIGGIRYTSYDFDTDNRRINITGETKSFDTTNFSMIANLIDKLNDSPLFDNAEMRSFTKSGSLESGYLANLRLTLDLEEETSEENTN